MNKIDKEWYWALKFLSKLSIEKRFETKKNNPKKYKKYVLAEVENTLEKFGYLTSNTDFVNTVTQTGLQQLRDLEEIRRKDLTLVASVTAVILSLVALAKSMGWL